MTVDNKPKYFLFFKSSSDFIGSFQLLCFFVAAMIKFTFTQLGQVLTPQQYVMYNVVIIIISVSLSKVAVVKV